MTQHAGSCSERPDAAAQTPGSAAERGRLLALLDERLRFESLLSRLSTTFINLPAEQGDSQIKRGLQQIVEFLGIVRSSVSRVSGSGDELVVTHSYVTGRYAAFPRVDIVPTLPWYTAKMRRGEILRYSRLPDELPPEAVHEREYCIQNGFRSHLGIPFKVGESILGGIGFGSFPIPRHWAEHPV